VDIVVSDSRLSEADQLSVRQAGCDLILAQ
jgi:hypothetical protein